MMDKVTHSLSELNQVEAKQYIGGVVFVSIMMVFGFVGNFHVILVYAFRIKPSNHRIFILVLGALDFITCIVGMPFIIFDLRNPLTFTVSSACKILRFLNYFICSASVLTLTVIAIERYRKICVPFGRQMSRKMAILMCLLVIFIALCISWPAPVLFGISSVTTSDQHINGTKCFTESRKNFQTYQGYFNAILIFILIFCFIVLVVLYTLTWRVIVRQSRLNRQKLNKQMKKYFHQSDDISNATALEDGNIPDNNADEGPVDKYSLNKEIFIVENDHDMTTCNGENENIGRDQTNKQRETHDRQKRYLERSRKTTFIFLIITAVFFLSYIPHLTLKVVTFTKKDFLVNMPYTEKFFYNTFIWGFFINNMTNGFVYGFFDLKFRRELKAMYTELFHLASH